jgi:hypothetical protein
VVVCLETAVVHAVHGHAAGLPGATAIAPHLDPHPTARRRLERNVGARFWGREVGTAMGLAPAARRPWSCRGIPAVWSHVVVVATAPPPSPNAGYTPARGRVDLRQCGRVLEEGVVNRSTIVVVVVTFVLGVLAGLAFAEWLVSAATAIGIALVLVAVALIAYFLIRHRIRSTREADEPPAVA